MNNILYFFKNIVKPAVNISHKILFVITIYGIVLGLFAIFFYRNTDQGNYNPNTSNDYSVYKIIDDPKLNQTKDGKITILLSRIFTCALIGQACTDNPIDDKVNYNKSILGFSGNLLSLPYSNPPASGIYWIQTSLANTGFIPKTYAQTGGIGFASLSAFSNLWNAFRKIAYLILVLILITIGFMIMFRMKLNPQTVISVENALPRIVVALLIITFSYAIAGFLIDLMYFITFIGIEILIKSGNLPADQVKNYKDNLINAGMFNSILGLQNFNVYFWGLLGIFDMLPWVVRQILNFCIGVVIIFWAMAQAAQVRHLIMDFLGVFGIKIDAGVIAVQGGGTLLIGPIIATIISLILIPIIGFIISLLFLALFVVIGLLFLIFRIFFTLLSSLIQIILYIMFAPLILMFEAIPGKSTFSSWLKNIIGNLIVFPATIFLVILVSIIINLYSSNKDVFTPPFLSDINSQTLAAIIASTMLLMIPDLIGLIKQAIIGKDGLQIPMNAGILFGAATTTVGAASSGLSQLYYLSSGIHALETLKGGETKDLQTGEKKTTGLAGLFKKAFSR